MVKPYLNQVGGEVEDDVATFAGGLNTYVDKAFLESDQMPFCMNVEMRQPPAIETRMTRETIARSISGEQRDTLPWDSGNIIRMWAYNRELIYFVIKDNPLSYKVYMLMWDSTLSPSGYSVTLIHEESSSYIESAYFCYCRTGADEYLYLSGEKYKARTILRSTDPNDWYTYTPLDDSPYGIPAWHKCRLFLLRPSEGVVEWSNTFMPDDFTPAPSGDSGELKINSSRGDLTALASFDDKLIIFCEHSIHAIYGNSGVATEADYFQVVDLLGTLGCLKQEYVAVSGAALYWYGDDYEIYEYTGASIHMISRPGKTRNETISVGGVSGLIGRVTSLAATSSKLYVDTPNGWLFVFDTYNKVWWAQDGGFSTICNYSQTNNNILMATAEGDILTQDYAMEVGGDGVYDWEKGEITYKKIEYEFHTRVYGADGADLRETLSDIWLQCSAYSDVYLTDVWNVDVPYTEWARPDIFEENLIKIGDTTTRHGSSTPETYHPNNYAQQRCIVPKMYGQRLNTFQIVVKGKDYGKFYLMKRKWRAR